MQVLVASIGNGLQGKRMEVASLLWDAGIAVRFLKANYCASSSCSTFIIKLSPYNNCMFMFDLPCN